MTAPAERWVVRYDGAPGVEYFRWGQGNYPARIDEQGRAHRFLDRVDALNVASNTGGKACRLVSRAEAVARAAKRARVEALEEVRAGLNQIACGSERRAVAAVADAIALVDRLAKESG